MIEVREYIDEWDKSLFGRWFSGLNGIAAAKAHWKEYKLSKGE